MALCPPKPNPLLIATFTSWLIDSFKIICNSFGIIQADAFFKAGLAKKTLVIGAETLSRVIDHYDRDSMIFSDGAGAAIVEYY